MLGRLGLWMVMALAVVGPVVLLTYMPWWALLATLLLLAAWMASTRIGQQSWSVTQVGIATIPQRLGSSSVVVIGIAGVVGVLIAVLAMAAGFETTLRETGTDDTVVVTRAGAQTELNSIIDQDTAVVVTQAKQVLHNAAGQPIASPELVVIASLPKKSDGLDANVEIRGVGQRGWELRHGQPHGGAPRIRHRRAAAVTGDTVSAAVASHSG